MRLSSSRIRQVATRSLACAALLSSVACVKETPAPSNCAVAGTTFSAAGATAAAGSAAGGSNSAGASAGGTTGAAPSGGETSSGGAPVLGMPDATSCAALALSACTSGGSCQVLSGRRISLDPPCLNPPEEVACGTKDGCVATAVRATDAMGQDWIFDTSCLPAGFVDATSTGTRFDDCAPAPENSGGGGGEPPRGGNGNPQGGGGNGGTGGSGGSL